MKSIKTIRKGTRVKLSLEAMNQIMNHVNESFSFYRNSNDRSIKTVKEHVTRGKMAEYGYFLMLKEAGIATSLTDLTNHKNGDDGGFDFKINGWKVDVKSLDASKPGYFQVPISEQLRAEAYVLCWVDMCNKTVTYGGAITREKIGKYGLLEEGKNPVTGKSYKYVNKSHLKELNENFE